MVKLDKQNCQVKKAPESGNLYITHPQFKQLIRLYANEEELKKDTEWRNKVALREGDYGFYALVAKNELEELDL